MIVNADITIFNKRYVREERTEKLVASRIHGVSLHLKKDTSSGDKELTKSDPCTIRIPIDADMEGKEYADQRSYEVMDDETYPGYWTLQSGAFIVNGLSDLETATETELREKYLDVIQIRNFTDNRDRCSDAMKHWRIGGE